MWSYQLLEIIGYNYQGSFSYVFLRRLDECYKWKHYWKTFFLSFYVLQSAAHLEVTRVPWGNGVGRVNLSFKRKSRIWLFSSCNLSWERGGGILNSSKFCQEILKPLPSHKKYFLSKPKFKVDFPFPKCPKRHCR